MIRMSDEMHNLLLANAIKRNYESRFMNYVTRGYPAPMFQQVAGVNEDDPRWLRLKEEAINRLPTGAAWLPSDWDRLYSQMNEQPKPTVMPAGGTEEPNSALSDKEVEFAKAIVRELYPIEPFQFSRGFVRNEAATGLFLLGRRVEDRQIAMKMGSDLTLDKLSWTNGMKQSDVHMELLRRGYGAVLYKAVYRTQTYHPASPKYGYDRAGRYLVLNHKSKLGGKWNTGRRRIAQNAPAEFNLWLSLFSTNMIKKAKARFPLLLNHKSEHFNAHKLNKWLEKMREMYDSKVGAPGRLRKRGGAFKPCLLMLDVPQMDMSVPQQIVHLAEDQLDEMAGPWGWSWLKRNGPSVAADPVRNADRLLLTHESNYLQNSQIGMRMRSGDNNVYYGNQACIVSSLCKLFQKILGRTIGPSDLDEGDTLAVLSAGDDNLIICYDSRLAESLINHKGKELGLQLDFDSLTHVRKFDSAIFLAQCYVYDDKTRAITPHKTLESCVLNRLCSEGGLKQLSSKHWIRNNPKGGVNAAGIGQQLAKFTYCMNDDANELYEIMNDLYKKHLGMTELECFPADKEQLLEMLKFGKLSAESDEWQKIDFIHDPDAVYKHRLEAEEFDDETLNRFFISYTPEEFHMITDNAFDKGWNESGNYRRRYSDYEEPENVKRKRARIGDKLINYILHA